MSYKKERAGLQKGAKVTKRSMMLLLVTLMVKKEHARLQKGSSILLSTYLPACLPAKGSRSAELAKLRLEQAERKANVKQKQIQEQIEHDLQG